MFNNRYCKKVITTGALIAALALPSACLAAGESTNYAVVGSSNAEYVLSGLLRSNEDGIVLKLVQAVKTAASRDEAVGAFTREVLATYPGYSVVDTLVTPVPRKKSECGTPI